jgi:hypothetical protein
MADRELIAAILTAGMLPTLEMRKAAHSAEAALSLGLRARPYNTPLTMPLDSKRARNRSTRV